MTQKQSDREQRVTDWTADVFRRLGFDVATTSPAFGEVAAVISQAHNRGLRDGYTDGYRDGYTDGYRDGYTDGHKEGWVDADRQVGQPPAEREARTCDDDSETALHGPVAAN